VRALLRGVSMPYYRVYIKIAYISVVIAGILLFRFIPLELPERRW
jgi:hypothetical protein